MKRLVCTLAVLAFALSTPAFAEEDLDSTVDVLADEVEEKSPWTAQIDFGAFYTAGNTDTRGVTLGASTKRETKDTIFFAFLSYLYSENDKIRSANETILGARYDWKFDDETWYIYTGANAERDEFENLDLRAQFFVGAGIYLEKSEDLTLRLETAPAATYLDYWDDSGEEWVAEWIFSFFGEWQITEQLVGRQWIRWMPNLTHRPNYRSNWITELETPIADNIAAKLSFIWDRNTDPAPGVKKDDIKVLLSVVWRF